MRTPHRREIMVGLVLVTAVAVTVLGTLFLKGYDWRGDLTEVEALVEEAGQLRPGNAVKVRGVEIGRVEDILVEPSGQAIRLVMRITQSVTLPPDAVVLLAPESMFGDWQAEIVPRSSFPRYAFFEVDEPGVLAGYALPDISRLTAAADEIADNLTVLTDRVELAFTEETALNLKAAIDNIGEVSQGLDALITQQAQSFDRLTGEIQESAEEFGGAARSARMSFDEIGRILAEGSADTLIGDARVALRNLRDVSERLDHTTSELDHAIRLADTALVRFDRLGQRLESGDGTLGRLFADSALAFRAESALLELNALLQDFRENPKRYVRLSIF